MSHYGNISSEISSNDLDLIMQKLDEIKALMPFLVNLTNEKRKAGLKLGDKSIAFVEKCLEYVDSTPSICPSYLDAMEFEKDVRLYKTLKQVLRALQQLVESVDDTALAVGKEAFDQALGVYHNVAQAQTRNIPGVNAIQRELKKRFFASRFKAEGSDDAGAEDTDGIQSPDTPAA